MLQEFIVKLEEDLTFKHVKCDPHWQAAMDNEMDSIQKMETQKLVYLPPGKKAVISQWFYRKKPGPNGVGCKYKTCLLARSYKQ